MKYSARRNTLFLLATALLAACTAAQTIGKMTGTVKSGGSSTAFQINFTSLEYTQPENTQLTLTLDNLSDDKLVIQLRAKGSGSSFAALFPTGTYTLADKTVTSVAADVTAEGASKQSFGASAGSLTLSTMEVNGNKISRLAGSFDFTDSGETHFWGHFDVDYEKN